MNNRGNNPKAQYDISREVRLDESIRDLQMAIEQAQSIYDTLRTDPDHVVSDTQIHEGVPHRLSRLTSSMKAVLGNSALINHLNIINPRKDNGGNSVEIIAHDKNIPGRAIAIREVRGDYSELQDFFFVDDSHSRIFSDDDLKVMPSSDTSTIVPWLLAQGGYTPQEIMAIQERESDPLRYAVDTLSWSAEATTHVEEIHAELADGLVVGGQKIERRSPSDPLSRDIQRLYTLWLTTNYDSTLFESVTERTVIRFSPDDPLLLHPDNERTSIQTHLEMAIPQDPIVLQQMAQERALRVADGTSVELIDRLSQVLDLALTRAQP